jgi:hypothetical protein
MARQFRRTTREYIVSAPDDPLHGPGQANPHYMDKPLREYRKMQLSSVRIGETPCSEAIHVVASPDKLARVLKTLTTETR